MVILAARPFGWLSITENVFHTSALTGRTSGALSAGFFSLLSGFVMMVMMRTILAIRIEIKTN